MVSCEVLTGEPLELLECPDAAIELIAWLRAESDAIDAALTMVLPVALVLVLELLLIVVVAALVTVPAGALVVCAPLALPPEVLINKSFRMSGLCQ